VQSGVQPTGDGEAEPHPDEQPFRKEREAHRQHGKKWSRSVA